MVVAKIVMWLVARAGVKEKFSYGKNGSKDGRSRDNRKRGVSRIKQMDAAREGK